MSADVSLHAGSPAVRCTVELDNRGRDHRLRLRLRAAPRRDAPRSPAGRSGRCGPAVEVDAVALMPPGRRRCRRRRRIATSRCRAHRGLAFLAPGFFEYEHTAGGDLLFTMFRAIGQLSRADLPTRPGHAGLAHRHTARPVARARPAAARPLRSAGEPRGRRGAARAMGGRLPPAPHGLAPAGDAVGRASRRPYARGRRAGALRGEAAGRGRRRRPALLQRSDDSRSTAPGTCRCRRGRAWRTRADEREPRAARARGRRPRSVRAARARSSPWCSSRCAAQPPDAPPVSLRVRCQASRSRLTRRLDAHATCRPGGAALSLPHARVPGAALFPCPHHSACCAYGVTLSDDEAAAIARAHGADRSTAPAGASGAPGSEAAAASFCETTSAPSTPSRSIPRCAAGSPGPTPKPAAPMSTTGRSAPSSCIRPELVQIHRTA